LPGLEFSDIRKSFGAVKALTGVSFGVAAAEAHALVGENGAGKSTLLKILAGLIRPDAGHITWQDEPFVPSSPRDAIDRGVGMVYQEMVTFPNLSVAANIFAGRELTSGGRLRESAMRTHTRELLGRLHLDLDPDAPADSLSAAHRQLLQVARALAFDCRILVLDEPTTSLTDAEADHLFAVLQGLKATGTTMLYVSHRLQEVFRLCDRITVLRDGAFVSTFPRAEVSPDEIVRAMVGRELGRVGQATDKEPNPATSFLPAPPALPALPALTAPPALELRRLSRKPCFYDVSMRVARGEIVALFGLVGSGRTELVETIFGLHHASGGDLLLDGRVMRGHSPREAAAAGVALVPEERQRQGLFFNLNLRHNLVLPRSAVRGTMRIDAVREDTDASALLREWQIKAPSPSAMPDALSGGNQQKVVLAKWMATNPRVLLLDEPTKGVDVGAKFDIHETIRGLAAAGLAVLVVSSDLPEVLSLADRVIVMREGRVRGELPRGEATEEAVMRLATLHHPAPVPHHDPPAAGARSHS
jgi:rhamnose transport system ATP-binding protein